MENMDELFDEVRKKPQEQKEKPPFNKEEYKTRKRQEQNDVYALLDKTAEEVRTSGEKLQSYLDVQARFDRYSVNNALLILAQRPNATKLADFDTWKAADVRVEKGETGISILEPGKEYERKNGEKTASFHVKKVFDISQTNGEAQPAPAIRNERLLLKALITDAPCKMEISDTISEDLNAIYKPMSKTIFIRRGLDTPTIFRSLANELAHAHMDKGNYRRNEHVATAFCVAYSLCRRCGVPTDTFRFETPPDPYLQMSTQEFRSELGRVREITGKIVNDMSRFFAQEKAQKERSGEAREETR